MAIISASLNDFNIKIRNNIELAYTHIEKVVELSENIDITSSNNEEIRELFNDFKNIKIKIKELEEWSYSSSNKTQDILDNMLSDANKLPSFYITDRIKLSK